MPDEIGATAQESQIAEKDKPTVLSQQQKSKKNFWVILGIVLITACICLILCIVLVVIGVGSAFTERAPVESVLDTFMTHMAKKDAESAYALLSPRVQRKASPDDLEKQLVGNNYILFDGYKNLSVQNINLTATVNANPDLPQGTVAKVAGVVSYDGGFKGQINAVLEKVEDVWKIYSVNVTVPPDKFQPK